MNEIQITCCAWTLSGNNEIINLLFRRGLSSNIRKFTFEWEWKVPKDSTTKGPNSQKGCHHLRNSQGLALTAQLFGVKTRSSETELTSTSHLKVFQPKSHCMQRVLSNPFRHWQHKTNKAVQLPRWSSDGSRRAREFNIHFLSTHKFTFLSHTSLNASQLEKWKCLKQLSYQLQKIKWNCCHCQRKQFTKRNFGHPRTLRSLHRQDSHPASTWT